MALPDWAFGLARSKLEIALPRRWAHVQGVARQARNVRVVAGEDADLLEAAAILHDVGYAPDLAATQFHPLDGAVFLADAGAPERLVNLVAHHTCAVLEAQLRGIEAELARFTDELGPVRDALWYCDQTTSPDGETVTPQARVAEIKQRYGPDHLVVHFITAAAPELQAAIERTECRLGVPVHRLGGGFRPAGQAVRPRPFWHAMITACLAATIVSTIRLIQELAADDNYDSVVGVRFTVANKVTLLPFFRGFKHFDACPARSRPFGLWLRS